MVSANFDVSASYYPSDSLPRDALTPEEEKIFCGWVLAENERNEKVDLSTSQAFVEHFMGTKMSRPTVQRMLHRPCRPPMQATSLTKMRFWKWQQNGSMPTQMPVSSMFTHLSWEA